MTNEHRYFRIVEKFDYAKVGSNKKCGKDYSTVSLEKFCRKFKSYADCPVVFHPLDVKTEHGILYLPLYMAGMIAKG